MGKRGWKKKRAPSPVAMKNRYHGPASVRIQVPDFPTIRTEGGLPIPKVVMSGKAWRRIMEVILGDAGRECGALLIGNILRDGTTGATVALVDDAFSDGEYGSRSEYRFPAALQAQCLNYVCREYAESKRVIGTIHSHGVHDAFFSSVDYRMMEAHRSEEIHIVLSPSHRTYVCAFKDRENVFSEADLDMTHADLTFGYGRNGI